MFGSGMHSATCEKERKKKKEETKREMQGTNILTDEKNKCFNSWVHSAEVSHIPNYDITVGVMAAAVAFVK